MIKANEKGWLSVCNAGKYDFKKMQKILKNNEYSLIRIKGSHFVYSNGERTVSINKDLNMMVAKRLIKENELCIM